MMSSPSFKVLRAPDMYIDSVSSSSRTTSGSLRNYNYAQVQYAVKIEQ